MEKLFDLPEQRTVETDVIIIGGGIVGLSAAYFLARRGRQVAVLERRTFGWEASGRTAAGVRQQGRDPREIPVAKFAVSLWATLNEELGGETGYRRGGNIYVALTEDRMRGLRALAERERALGLQTELLDARSLRELVPLLSDRCIGGKYCPTDGIAEPTLVIPSLVNAVRRVGGGLYPETEALDLVVEDAHIVAIVTDKFQFQPRIVVIAAGPWTPLLTAHAGVELPITAVRSILLQTEPVGHLFKEFLIFEDQGIFCRPTLGDSVLIGGVSARATPGPTPVSVAHEKIGSLVPRLSGVPIRRTWSGLLDMTPDEVPVIGLLPGVKNCLVAAGFSGHGFCLGPGVGKLLSEMIADGTASVPLDAFSCARFGAPATR